MWQKFGDFLARHDELRSGLRVAVYTFLASFGLALMGFLADVSAWATGNDVEFPSVTPLGKAFAAALVAAVSGVIAYLYNKLPSTKTAQYEPPFEKP